MKVQIVSDLHTDLNGMDFGFHSNLKDVDLTLIAGDISGSYLKEEKYLNYIKEQIGNSCVIAIAGNHIGYDYDNVESTLKLYGSSEDLVSLKSFQITKSKQFLQETFKQKPIIYLENKYIEFDKYIIFGGTMYTNFSLYERKICEKVAVNYLNDFRYCHYSKGVVTPECYRNWFVIFKDRLYKCIRQTEKQNKDIIVLSHFAPSIKSINDYYLNQRPSYTSPGFYLNACYASPVEYIIKNNPRIKYWIHGHTHLGCDYNIEQCHVICEPYGYKFENIISPNEYKGKIIEI